MKSIQKTGGICHDSAPCNAREYNNEYSKRKTLRAGFTLIEIIVIMSIIAILAAIAVPSMIGFIEHGKQIKRMDTARTIYLAAQNQLTEKRITKNLMDFVTNNKSDSSIYIYDEDSKAYSIQDDDVLLALDTNVSKALGDDFPSTDSGNEPYVHYIGKPKGDYPDSAVYKLLAPVILDKSILNDAILIEYNIKTGIVLSVFYGDTVDNLGYGSLDGTLSKNEKVDGNRLYDDASNRKQGYYGVDKTFGLPEEVQTSIMINVYDGAFQPLEDAYLNKYTNVLYSEILIPKKLLSGGQKYDLKIGGASPGGFTNTTSSDSAFPDAFTDTFADVADSGFIFHDAFTNAASSSFTLSTLMGIPAVDHIIYKIDTMEDYYGFVWILDYVGGDMTDDILSSRNIGAKYTVGIAPDKNTSVSLLSESGTEIAYSNEFSPYYISDLDINYRNQIKISSARHLYNMRYNPEGRFALVSDIDMLPDEDAPNAPDRVLKIESNNYEDATGNALSFSGIFTGQNHAISSLNVQGNGFFEAITGRAEYLTLINPSVSATGTTAGVLSGTNGGSICDVVIISDSMDSPVSGGLNVGGVVGANKDESGNGGRISRVLYLAVAPEKNGVIYPIASTKEGTVHNPSVVYLSGAEIRPQPIAGGVYNPSAKALTDVGTARGTDELYTLGVGSSSPFKGYGLNSVSDPIQAGEKTAEQYPYPHLGTSAVFDGFAWPLTGGENTSLRYYEVYTDNSIGYYYYDFTADNFINTLKKDDGRVIKDDGYIIITNNNLSLSFGGGATSVYSPSVLTLGAYSVRAVKISDSVITSGYTTPISITGSGLPSNLYFNPLFAAQIFVGPPAPGMQGGAWREIEIRSPRQLANITKSADISSPVTYRQTLDISFSEYGGFDQYKPNESGEFTQAIVNSVFSATSIYDGLGKRISGVKINTNGQYSGIFSRNAGIIRNVNIYNSDIAGANHVGALVGENQSSGILSTVSAIDSSVAGTNFTGGLAGTNSGIIENAFVSYTSNARGAIDLNPQGDSWVAGVVRTSGFSSAFGGLIGSNAGTVVNAYVASYVGGDNDSIVKPIVGSGNTGTNVFYLYGNNFNSNIYSPEQGMALRAYELSDLVGDGPFNNGDIWSIDSVEYGNYPYPVFANALIPNTWCAPAAPAYPLKYYEIYSDDYNSDTLDYGLWGGADDDTLQYGRVIIADGYLLYTENTDIKPDDMKIFIGPSPESTENLYTSSKPGYSILDFFGSGACVTVLSTEALENASLGLSPVYLKIGLSEGSTDFFEGWVNPLFAKAIFNAKPSSNYEHIIHTPRHIKNIGSEINSSISGYISPLGGKFRQETDVVFTNLNVSDRTGYIMVDNPCIEFSGDNVSELVFEKAGVTGEFSGSYNGSYGDVIKRIIDFKNTGTGQIGVGIFEKIVSGGVVENLLIVNSSLSGTSNVGGVAGTNNGIIKSVHVACSNPNAFTYEASGSDIGGIAGVNSGIIEMCAVENQSVKGFSRVGGLVGNNSAGSILQDVYYVDTRTSVSPLESMIKATAAEDLNAGGIVGYNSGTVTRALCLGIAPKIVISPTETKIYPIVGGGSDALKHEGSATCFYAAGSAYSLTKGTNYVVADYNYASETVEGSTKLSGGGFGYDTAFLELEFVAMMDTSTDWENWTYGVRAGSKPYPYAIVGGMTPPDNWHEVSGSGKPPQQERSDNWESGTEGTMRAKNLNLINPDFDLPVLRPDGAALSIFGTTNTNNGRNFSRYYINPPYTSGTEYYSDTFLYAYNMYPSSGIQGWSARLNTTSPVRPNLQDAIQLLSVWYMTGNSTPTANNDGVGRTRTNYLGNANNATAGVYSELNAHEPGTLYQICATVPGTELYYSFYHATRGDNRADGLNFGLSGVTGGDSSNVQYTDGIKTIRPCLTLRGSHGTSNVNSNKYTRWTVNYAYINGISGSLCTFDDSSGRATFYDPNPLLADGSPNPYYNKLRTAYLYDIWVGEPAGEGYGITFWSENNYTVLTSDSRANANQLRQLGVTGLTATNTSGSKDFGRNTTALEEAKNNIIGYWDAAIINYSGTSSEMRANGCISEWKQYYGKYTVPQGQVWTEFAYQWRSSTSGGGEAYGNLIDGILFETPSYVTVSKAFDGVGTLYRNPGESTEVTLTAKNWGETPAKGIIITDTISPFDEYADMPENINSSSYKIEVRDAFGSVLKTFSNQETRNAVKYNSGTLTVDTGTAGIVLATNETITVTFTLKVRNFIRSNSSYDTMGYYIKNQAEVSSLDAKYIGYENTNPIAARDEKRRKSNIVQMYIDPIQLSKTAVEAEGINEKDEFGNIIQYYDVTLHMKSTFAGKRVSGLVNDAIPEGFKVVGNITVDKTNNAIVSTPRIVENGDGSTTIVVSNLVLDCPLQTVENPNAEGDEVTIKYRLKYMGDKYGTAFTNIDANYKYQFAAEDKQMTGAVAFPKPTVAIKIKTQDDVYRVAPNITDGTYLDIGVNDCATDEYHLSQGEYDTVDRYYMLLKEDGTEAEKNVNGQYEMTGTGYTATLMGDRILFKATGDMPNVVNIKYRVALTAVAKGISENIDLSSRDTNVTIYRLGNDIVYYEKYTDGSYGLYFADGDKRNTLSNTYAVEESGYALLSPEENCSVRARLGTSGNNYTGWNSNYISFDDAYLYPVTAHLVTNMTVQEVYYRTGGSGSGTMAGRIYPIFAKAIYGTNGSLGSSFAIRTPEQMQNISRIIDSTGGLTFVQERDLDFSAVLLTDSVVPGEFKGAYDGGGNSIKNVFINASAIDNIALFSQNLGLIENIKLITNTNIGGRNYVGGIAGVNRNSANITNCLIEGGSDGSGMHIEAGQKYVGGISGLNEGKITDCTVKNAVNTIRGKDYIGGIAGQNGPNAEISGVTVDNVRIRAEGINIASLAGENKNSPDKVVSARENNVTLESPKLPLKAGIEEALVLIESIIDDNEIGNYLAGTKADYQLVADAAQVVLDLEDAVSEDIQNAITSLHTAKQNLTNNKIYSITLESESADVEISVIDGIGEYSDRSVKGKTVKIDTGKIILLEGEGLSVRVFKNNGELDEIDELEIIVPNEGNSEYTFIMPAEQVKIIIDIFELNNDEESENSNPASDTSTTGQSGTMPSSLAVVSMPVAGISVFLLSRRRK